MMLEFLMEKYNNFFLKNDFSKLERIHIEDWLHYLIHEKKQKDATIRRKKISMRAFVKYLFDNDYISAELHNFFSC